jgi:hypothetical protein
MKERMDARFVDFARVWSSVWSRRAEWLLASRASAEAAQSRAVWAVRAVWARLAARVSAMRQAVQPEAAAAQSRAVRAVWARLAARVSAVLQAALLEAAAQPRAVRAVRARLAARASAVLRAALVEAAAVPAREAARGECDRRC